MNWWRRLISSLAYTLLKKALETEMNCTVWNQWDGLEETVDDQTDVLAGLFWP
jgi:hypothetical protein